MLGKIRFWKLQGPRNDAYGWAIALKQMFRCKFLYLEGPELYTGGKYSTCIFLSNHRSWGDFFLDVVATEGYAQMLSRWAVFFVFPVFMTSVIIVRSVVLFKRGAVKDKNALNDFIDRKLQASPIKSLIVYPEGHRSTKQQSLPMKRGMLHFAYDRKYPVQIVMSANKESVMSEKAMTAGFGQTIVVGYSEPIHSRQFPTFDDFASRVQKEWDHQWKRVYSSKIEDAKVQAPPEIDDRHYSQTIKGLMVVAVVATAGVAQNSWRKGLWKDSQQASAHCKFQCCNGLLKGGIMGVLHLHVRAYEPHCKFLQSQASVGNRQRVSFLWLTVFTLLGASKRYATGFGALRIMFQASAAILLALGFVSAQYPLEQGIVPNDQYTAAPAAAPLGTDGWRTGRSTFFDGSDTFKNAYIARGAGSFGDILYGSCEYASVRDGIARDYSDLPFDKGQVAALAQKDPDYPGSCGRCYEIRCQDGLVIGNGTTPVNIDEFYYLATVNDTVTDDYGRTFPGNSAFNQSEQSVQCWNDSSSIFVHIIDSCPAYQIKDGIEVQQLWCNSDIYHFDLSYWAFEQLAHPTYGVMMVDFRPVDCYTHESLVFTPGFVNATIYGDQVETGWNYGPYFLHSANFWLPGAGVSGSNATCVNVATKVSYNETGPGGGGLGFSAVNGTDAGYQPFAGKTTLDFWVKSNSTGPGDETEVGFPKGTLPDLNVYLSNAEASVFCAESLELTNLTPVETSRIQLRVKDLLRTPTLSGWTL
ncbi:hypothetical protein WJX82_001789 [Trebouxia sp. C0006]